MKQITGHLNHALSGEEKLYNLMATGLILIMEDLRKKTNLLFVFLGMMQKLIRYGFLEKQAKLTGYYQKPNGNILQKTKQMLLGHGAKKKQTHVNIQISLILTVQNRNTQKSMQLGNQRVAPVRSFPPNKYGVYDITGNVWEWAEDCSEINYKSNELDERANQVEGHCERRSVKGGSWLSKISRHRPSFRGRDPENLSSHIFGFRVARDL